MARVLTARVARQAVALLGDGEGVRSAVVAEPSESFVGRVSEDVVLGARLALDRPHPAGRSVAAGIPRSSVVLAVTDRRLTIFGLTRMGRLRSVVASFGPDDLLQLSAARRDRTTSTLTMVFGDGSICRYTVVRKQDAEGFVGDFEDLGRAAGVSRR